MVENEAPNILELKLKHPKDTRRFYESRNYEPAWSNDYTLLGVADGVIKAIRKCEEEGLVPSDYHFPKLNDIYNQIDELYDIKFMDDPQLLLKTDILLTDAALQYANHLRNGRLNPKSLDFGWNVTREKVDLVPPLVKAVADKNIAAYFAAQLRLNPSMAN